MKKLLLMLLLFTSTVSFSKDQEKTPLMNNFLTGYIIDYKTYEKLSGVKIKIIDTKTKEIYSTYSDLNGNYTFNNINRSEYKLIINYTSYRCDTVLINSDFRKLNIMVKSL